MMNKIIAILTTPLSFAVALATKVAFLRWAMCGDQAANFFGVVAFFLTVAGCLIAMFE